MHFNLFVYGTLKAGGPAASLLNGSEHLGRACVGGILYNIDDQHPALVLYGTGKVEGEIWRCPYELLAQLDNYESVEAGLFRRVGTEVTTDAGTVYPCWTYVAGPKLTRKLTADRQIATWNVTSP